VKKLGIYWIVSVALLGGLGVSVFVMRQSDTIDVAAAVAVNRRPHVRPDYHDAVIPPNIAPLNFRVEEAGTGYFVRIRSSQGQTIDVTSRTGQIAIPLSGWQRLLNANRGRKLDFDVCVRRADGRWERFEPIQNTIADADIDGYLFYRIIGPLYSIYTNTAIYQRELGTFKESLVASNRSFEGGCVNCHTFAPNHPDQMILHSRGSKQNPHWGGMLVVRRGNVIKVDTRALARAAEFDRGPIRDLPAGHTAWHPNGRLAVFAAMEVRQIYHVVGEARDVLDTDSDLALYHVDSNTVTTTPDISQPDRLETFPTWSPDGRYLYFSSREQRPVQQYEQIRCDLMRIKYEVDSGRWGELETVLSADDTGLSITQPRISPDGRWLLFCMSDYSSFPAFRSSSDLYLLDLETRRYHRLAANSPRSESWHCWSANSRWIAFTSKRRDGVCGRVYFSYIDEAGRAYKPVLLPQKDPSFYDRFIKTYNLPELARAPAPARGSTLARVIGSPGYTGTAKHGAGPSMHAQDVP